MMQPPPPTPTSMSYSLNSLKGGGYAGTIIGVVRGGTGSSDCCPMVLDFRKIFL